MSCNACSRQFFCDKKECNFKRIRDVEITKIGDDKFVQNKIRKFRST